MDCLSFLEGYVENEDLNLFEQLSKKYNKVEEHNKKVDEYVKNMNDFWKSTISSKSEYTKEIKMLKNISILIKHSFAIQTGYYETLKLNEKLIMNQIKIYKK